MTAGLSAIGPRLAKLLPPAGQLSVRTGCGDAITIAWFLKRARIGRPDPVQMILSEGKQQAEVVPHLRNAPDPSGGPDGCRGSYCFRSAY